MPLPPVVFPVVLHDVQLHGHTCDPDIRAPPYLTLHPTLPKGKSSRPFETTLICNTALSPMLFPPLSRPPLPHLRLNPAQVCWCGLGPQARSSHSCRPGLWTVGLTVSNSPRGSWELADHSSHRWCHGKWLTEVQLDLAKAKREITGRLLRNFIHQQKVGRSRVFGIRGSNAARTVSLSHLLIPLAWHLLSLSFFHILEYSTFWGTWGPTAPVLCISQVFHQRTTFVLSSILFQVILGDCLLQTPISRQIWYGLGQNHLTETPPQGTLGCVSCPEETGNRCDLGGLTGWCYSACITSPLPNTFHSSLRAETGTT